MDRLDSSRPNQTPVSATLRPWEFIGTPMRIDRGPISPSAPPRLLAFVIESPPWRCFRFATFLSYPFIHLSPLTWNMLTIFNWQKNIETYQKTHLRRDHTTHPNTTPTDASCGSLAAASVGMLGGCGPGRQRWYKTCIKVLSKHSVWFSFESWLVLLVLKVELNGSHGKSSLLFRNWWYISLQAGVVHTVLLLQKSRTYSFMIFNGQLPSRSTALLPLLVNLKVVFLFLDASPIDSTYHSNTGPSQNC